MKKIYFLMLAFGISVGSIAQPEVLRKDSAGVPDKWNISPIKNMKGALGQLDMNFPPGLDWNIGNLSITRQADNKYITSFSGVALRTKKIYNSAPGEYLIQLNNLPVENVPIQKGHVTKLKTGILKVDAEDRWEIYNEAKDKYLTSYNKPLKFAVPVGKYQVYIGGQYYPVTIRDGATAVVPSNDIGLREAEDITTEPIIMAPPEETDFYVMKPSGSIPEGKGRLYVDLDLNQYEDAIVRNLFCYVKVPSASLCDSSKDLTPGTYEVSFMYPMIYFVPVVKEKKTRIKAGYLVITFDRPWELFRKPPTGPREKIHVGDNKVTYFLPPGEYVLHVFGLVDWYYSTIKDGVIVVNGEKN